MGLVYFGVWFDRKKQVLAFMASPKEEGHGQLSQGPECGKGILEGTKDDWTPQVVNPRGAEQSFLPH